MSPTLASHLVHIEANVQQAIDQIQGEDRYRPVEPNPTSCSAQNNHAV